MYYNIRIQIYVEIITTKYVRAKGIFFLGYGFFWFLIFLKKKKNHFILYLSLNYFLVKFSIIGETGFLLIFSGLEGKTKNQNLKEVKTRKFELLGFFFFFLEI